MKAEFIPDATERYIDMTQLGARWKCHPKTASKRFRNLGGSALYIGAHTRFPLSQVIAIEREGVNRFARRTTEVPERFIKARERRKKEREEREARRQKKQTPKTAVQLEPAEVSP